ncbi:hypothetical protein M1B78_13595 [Bacteroides sp. KH569_7]|uniref:Two component regulator three Y domain-containing protein n=1 Tax=Bacteroides muris (ex Fokt et al. 2023) TaxID=2937417 RepID=A0A9X2P1K4_9BACE|nr:hypothetical protein [Bacteroides muris (ex Fokt et al. 2023)]MCR6509169.1 hypothetical protein [Bacteroides muris (ex Fokt et al. 2023)]
MRIAITFLLFLVFSSLLQASPIPFSPIVRSYSVSDYNAGIQNWSIAQDERGVMYFGNNNGLLEFDGSAWRLYELPTKGIVRAIYISKDGKIYVGSYEEFGYFVRTPYNTLEYHSLKDEVKDFTFHNDEIWNIVCVQGEIVFQSFGSLFFYNGNSVEGTRMKSLPLNLFQVGNTFYSQRINGGLCVFSGRKMEELIPRKAFGNSDVLAGLPYDDAVLMLTRNQGGFLYRDGRVEKWETECDGVFKKHTINRAVMTKDSCYVVGTISDGIYALDKGGKLIWKINTDNKLQNNTVLKLYCDDDNNIWTALDEGIAYIHNNSLIYYYEPPFRKIGMVYDVLVREDEAYIASNQGLYWLKDGKAELVPGLEEQAWFVDEWGKQIFCGHNKGTFLISGLKSKQVADAKGGMCMEKIELKEQSFLLEGTYALLNLYTENASGVYGFTRSLRGFSHMIRHMEVDYQGNIWAKHLRNGLYRFRIDSDMKQVKDVWKYESLGEVKGGSFTLFKINGRVVFSNGEYFYTYEDMTDSIVPYETMNEQLAELREIKTVSRASGDRYWFVGDRTVYLVKCAINTFDIELRIPYSLFDGLAVEERGSVAYDKRNNHSYLCLNNAIARIETDSSSLYKSRVKRSLWISGMRAIDEFSGERKTLVAQPGVRVESEFNTVSFTLCYPVYSDYTYKVRYKLDGYSEQWVPSGRSLQKMYARLPYGSYVFRAEIYDTDRVLASVELPFEILSPWYLSYWAVGGYILIGLCLLALLQYIVYRFVKKKKDRVIEQQRVVHQAELERQEKKIIELEKEQLEADLRFKSKELSSVVMMNIAHQEFLTSLKEEIQKQKLSGQHSRKNLDKLLALVNNNIVSDEENWIMFQANFDRIHENFFRNLKLQYTDLTSGDLRFCALLRLNMPTKEIAKLLNISTRGVDAARYRLRKKFNLLPEESLTDFLINFK